MAIPDPVLSLRVEPSDMEALRERARKRRTSVSAIVRELLSTKIEPVKPPRSSSLRNVVASAG